MKSRLFNYFSKKSIRFQTTIIPIAYSIILFLCLFFSYYIFYSSYTLKQSIQNSEMNLNLISTIASQNLRDISYLVNWISENPAIMTYLNYPGNDPQQFVTHERLNEEFQNNRSKQYISRLIVCSHDQKFLQIQTGNVAKASIYDASIVEQTLHINERALNTATLLALQNDPLLKKEKQIIPLIKNLQTYSNATAGWLYLSLSPDIITDATTGYTEKTNAPLYVQFGQNYYKIENNQLYEVNLTLDENYKEDSLTKNPQISIVRFQGNNTPVVRIESDINNIVFMQSMENAVPAIKDKFFFFTILFSVFAILVLSCLMIVYQKEFIVKPILKIKQKVNSISKGDFSNDLSIEGENEFGVVGHEINEMAGSIDSLIETKLIIESKTKELEMQMLQKQINPHFLYNTLNSIRIMSILQHTSGIPEMITSLSHLLKYVSKNGIKLITLQEELNLLQDYYTIQKYRYSGNLGLSIEKNGECDKILIPSLSLQPLVENAIFHGIEASGRPGHIHITISTEKNLVEINVSDNGIGIPKEALLEIQWKLDHNLTSDSIGIYNVNSRIKHYFGNEYGIKIKSIYGHSTTVTLLLSLKETPN